MTPSSFSKTLADERIDTNGQMDTLLTKLREGVYDYLIAWDDTRIARDSFYWVVVWHAEIGGCERHCLVQQPASHDLP